MCVELQAVLGAQPTESACVQQVDARLRGSGGDDGRGSTTLGASRTVVACRRGLAGASAAATDESASPSIKVAHVRIDASTGGIHPNPDYSRGCMN